MKVNLTKALFTLMMFAVTAINSFTSSAQEDLKMKKDGVKMKMDMDGMKDWPMASQMAVKEQTDLYGKPDEVTPTMVVWHKNGTWAKNSEAGHGRQQTRIHEEADVQC